MTPSRYLIAKNLFLLIFCDSNIVNHLHELLDGSQWDLEPSGLLGPVSVTPYRVKRGSNLFALLSRLHQRPGWQIRLTVDWRFPYALSSVQPAAAGGRLG